MGRVSQGFLILLVVVLSSAAAAQDYPSRPVRMIIPFGPGGSSDFVARAIHNDRPFRFAAPDSLPLAPV